MVNPFFSYIYLKFGADTKIEGIEFPEEIKKISNKAKENGLILANCPIRHLGTEKSHELYGKIEKYLLENNVEIKNEEVSKKINDMLTKKVFA